MSDDVDNELNAEEGEHPEFGTAAEYRALLPTLRTTLISQLVSILLHALVVVPIWIPGLIRSENADFDVEWMTQFEDLQGLGMSSGRWADVKMAPPEEDADQQAESPEAEVDEATEPPEEAPPEKKPEDELPDEPEEQPKPDPKPTSTQTASAIPKNAPQKELEPEKPKRPKNPYARGEDLPGINRSGPSELPDMEAYGPGNVVYSALVRLDRIRGTSFEEPTRRILENVPDYRIALHNTGIDPVDDIDSLFMASARPRYLQHTFLAVRHGMEPADIKSRLENRFVENAPWYDYRGYTTRAVVPKDSGYRDPRQIVLARPGLAVIARPEWLPEITGEVAADDPLAAGLELDDGERRPTMLDGLEQIERAVGEGDTLVAVSGRGVRLMLPGLGKIRFEAAKLVIANASAPKLTIDMTFDSPATARRFAQRCPDMKDEVVAQVPYLGQGLARNVLDPLECRASEEFVTIRADYDPMLVQRLMNFAVAFIPRPAVLQKLPTSPPPPRRPEPELEGRGGVDAGAEPDAGAESGAETTVDAAAPPSNESRGGADAGFAQ
jgi:hypothetical protein